MLTRRGASLQQRLTAVKAALTMNVGMIELQETLWSQAGPLTPEQRQGILEHPTEGVDLLYAAGVADREWLSIVAQHHEHVDGTGYPCGLVGANLLPIAQALMVAERWCAMVSPRGYRPAAPPDRALSLLAQRLDKEADPLLVRLLAEVVGLTPPGTTVQMASGEVGMVTRRSRIQGAPWVLALRSPTGEPYTEGVWRDTRDERLRIVGCVPRADLLDGVDPLKIWELTDTVPSAPLTA